MESHPANVLPPVSELLCVLPPISELLRAADNSPMARTPTPVPTLETGSRKSEWPAAGATSPEPVSTNPEASSPADQQLTVLGSESAPHTIASSMGRAAAQESVAAFASGDTSPYHIPPLRSLDLVYEVPPVDRRWPSRSILAHYHALNPVQSAGGWQEQQTTFRLLRSSRFRKRASNRRGRPLANVALSDQQILGMLKTWAFLLPRDPLECVRELPAGNTLRSIRHVLGLPEVWLGIDGTVNYLRVLDADHEGRSRLRPLSRRFAQIYLYLSYKTLSRNGDDSVITRVLDAYHDDPNIAKPKELRRRRLSAFHLRRGRWWWRFATSLGFGLLLVADDKLIKGLGSHSFTNDQIDAFITFVVHTRPGTVRLFESLTPMAISLLGGIVPINIRHNLMNEINGPLRRHAINRARGEDQQALAFQRAWNTWEVMDTRSVAKLRKTEFLVSLRSTG
ncbi:hypothetical protein BJX96DRAFT_177014 [Aspergillus floccosus]